MQRVGGALSLKVDGEVLKLRGTFSWNTGGGERESVMGIDVMHGYSETPVPAFIAGEITLGHVSVARLKSLTNVTVSLELGEGKTVVLSRAHAVGEWSPTQDGSTSFRFEGPSAKEIV